MSTIAVETASSIRFSILCPYFSSVSKRVLFRRLHGHCSRQVLGLEITLGHCLLFVCFVAALKSKERMFNAYACTGILQVQCT